MKRRHLIELEDEQWFPAWLRDYGTDYLQWVINVSDAYRDLVPFLERGLARTPHKQVIDIAAGGGGGWKRLAPRLKAAVPEAQVLLTDFYPNLRAFKQLAQEQPGTIAYREAAVNALDVPGDLRGMRTQFLSFHHFQPEQAQQILQNAVDARAPIMIVEVTERSVKQVIQFIFTPLLLFFLTPFIKPFKLGRLFFTYIIPLLPPFITWDGIASAFRTYTPEEIQAMTARLRGGDSYEWEIGWHGKGPRRMMVALGLPKV